MSFQMPSHTQLSENQTLVNQKRVLELDNNNDRFAALCPGLPRWAGTRRNTHPPTIL